MSKPERLAEEATVKWARARGIPVTKMNLLGQRSWPDRVFWLDGGRPLLIEFKRAGKHPTRLQQSTIDELKRLNYDVIATSDRQEAIRALQTRCLANTNRELSCEELDKCLADRNKVKVGWKTAEADLRARFGTTLASSSRSKGGDEVLARKRNGRIAS